MEKYSLDHIRGLPFEWNGFRVDLIRMEDLAALAEEISKDYYERLTQNIALIPENMRRQALLDVRTKSVLNIVDTALNSYWGQFFLLERCLARVQTVLNIRGLAPDTFRDLFREVAGRSGIIDPKDETERMKWMKDRELILTSQPSTPSSPRDSQELTSGN